jgi:hypothetical protein
MVPGWPAAWPPMVEWESFYGKCLKLFRNINHHGEDREHR